MSGNVLLFAERANSAPVNPVHAAGFKGHFGAEEREREREREKEERGGRDALWLIQHQTNTSCIRCRATRSSHGSSHTATCNTVCSVQHKQTSIAQRHYRNTSEAFKTEMLTRCLTVYGVSSDVEWDR